MKVTLLRSRRFLLQALIVVFPVILAACSSTSLEHGEKAPDRPLLSEALALLRAGKTDQAETRLIRLAGERPLVVEAHRELQQLRIKRYEHLGVFEEYRQLAEEEARSAAARYLFGRLLYRTDDQEREFRAGAETDPQSPWGHYGLAWVSATRGDLDQAFRHINNALAVRPAHKRTRYLLARLLVSQERHREARGVLGQLLEQDPGMIEAQLLKARNEGSEQRFDAQLGALESALQIDPGNDEARSMLLALQALDPDGGLGFLAADLARSAVARSVGGADDFDFLARVESRLGNRSASRQAAAEALERGARSPSLLELAHDEASSFLDAWGALYETGALELNRPILELQRLVKDGADRGALAEAFARAGFLDFASRLLDDLGPASTDTDRVARLRSELRAHRRVLSRIELLARRVRRDKKAEGHDSTTAFLQAVATIIEAETGYACNKEETVLGLPLVGSALDTSAALEGTVNGYLRRFNQVMFAGRLEGSHTQAMVFTAFSGPTKVFPPGWPEEEGCTEVIGGLVRVRPDDQAFGDSAGRALFGSYFIDLDVLLPWKRRLAGVLRLDEAARARVRESRGLTVGGGLSRRSLVFPAFAAESLILKSWTEHKDLLLLDSVRVHEQGHLFDSFNYLPLWQQVIPNLLLVLKGGFSSLGIMAELEEAAALHALIHSRSPALALAELVRALPQGDPSGPHAAGYKNLLERFLLELDNRLAEFPALDPERLLVHQLHRLSADEIRAIARAL